MKQAGADYVTDTTYPAGYYREQAPQHMHLACLLNGVQGLDPTAPLTYLELGCGYGFVATALAASNPHWRVIGIDLMQAHIDAARALADEAGLQNIHFIQGDLTDFAETPAGQALPEADVVSMHGLWSWVPQAVRDGVVRLLDAKLRPGGLAQVSYNSLPGWQSAIGMQRLIRQTGLKTQGSSNDQAVAGLQSVMSLMGARAMHLAYAPFVQAMLNALNTSTVDYLAHEYMNGSWTPFFHTDVAHALAPAGLQWAASANLMENLVELTLTPAQQQIYEQSDDRLVRELIKDMCLFRGFRNDVFVRGIQPLDPAMRARALRETVLAAQAAPEKFSCKIFIPRPNIPREPIALPEAIYAPVVARLAKGPCKLGDLLALASVTDPLMLTHDDPAAELIAILVGAHYAMPIFGTAVPPPGTAQTFNALAANRLIGSKKPESGIAVSTAGIGTPLPCTVLQAFVLAHLQHATSAAQISAMLPPELQADAAMGRAIEDILKKDVPVWRLLLPTSSESLS